MYSFSSPIANKKKPSWISNAPFTGERLTLGKENAQALAEIAPPQKETFTKNPYSEKATSLNDQAPLTNVQPPIPSLKKAEKQETRPDFSAQSVEDVGPEGSLISKQLDQSTGRIDKENVKPSCPPPVVGTSSNRSRPALKATPVPTSFEFRKRGNRVVGKPLRVLAQQHAPSSEREDEIPKAIAINSEAIELTEGPTQTNCTVEMSVFDLTMETSALASHEKIDVRPSTITSSSLKSDSSGKSSQSPTTTEEVDQNLRRPLEMSSQLIPPVTPASNLAPKHAHFTATPMNTMGLQSKRFLLNGKQYMKLGILGKGGSSKVYKVLTEAMDQIYALKRVNLRGIDKATKEGYKNEVQLLKRLSNCDSIIKLYDFDENEDHMQLLMECGDIDLAHVLQQQKTKLNINFIRVYWEQMLRSVHAIHEERVVHSDLKPANFLFVKGSLKLIDFGIAKAIQNDTTNIHREHQVGTINYMSPEAIIDINSLHGSSKGDHRNQPCMKLGRPSDVWSLGCILYQMVYGRTPFSHYPNMIQKLQHIIDPSSPIEYPPVDCAYLTNAIKGCLRRNLRERLTIPQLLEHPFLRPDLILSALLRRETKLSAKETLRSLVEKLQGKSNDEMLDELEKFVKHLE